MENVYTQENKSSPVESKSNYIHLKFKKPTPRVIAIGAAVILILVALFFAKGFFVAATVNGSPISRVSIIKGLEKQGGKQALEALINKKLIETELDKQNVSVAQEEIDGEIKKIEEQMASQGGTLKDALAMQGMTEEMLREQIAIQKRLEKLLADKIAVSNEEIDAYIADNKIAPSENMPLEDIKKQVGEQLGQQKLQQEVRQLVSSLTARAKIKYYVSY